MTVWEAFFFGIIQGITEFLPISSSGHLILFQHLLGFQNLKEYIFFDLLCHLGTLGAVIAFFHKEIQETLYSTKKLCLNGIALLPLFILLPFFKDIKLIFDHPRLISYAFFITSLILFSGKFAHFKTQTPFTKMRALLIGLSQTLAIIPGISRSGTTITAGKWLQLSPYQAVSFSFLLSIPTILGGIFLESYALLTKDIPLPSISFSAYAIGSLSAFIFGFLALKLLIRIVETGKFQLFAWYCLALGIFTFYLF